MPTSTPLEWTCEPLTLDAVRALEPQWTALANAAAERTIFHFPWYVLPSLPLLAAFDPYLVTVRDEGVLVGLVIVRGHRGFAKLPIPFLRTALHPEQFLGTPLVRSGKEGRFAEGLFAWLDAAPRHYCLLHLGMMSGDGPVFDAIREQCRAQGRGVLTLNRAARAAINLPRPKGSIAQGHLPASRRKSLRRKAAALAELGRVTHERLNNPDELDAWTADFLKLEDSGWKREKRSSILCCPKETALYRALVRDAQARGMLNFFRLCLDGRPIAYTLDIGAAPDIFCLKSAMDQDFKKHSAGVLAEVASLDYYCSLEYPCRVDSCTSPNNDLLNELWPDRKPLVSLSIARRGFPYGAIFGVLRLLKQVKYGPENC